MRLRNRAPRILGCLLVLVSVNLAGDSRYVKGGVLARPGMHVHETTTFSQERQENLGIEQVLADQRRAQVAVQVAQDLKKRIDAQIDQLVQVSQLTASQRDAVEVKARRSLDRVTNQAKEAIRLAVSVDRWGNELITIQKKHNHLAVEELSKIVRQLAESNVVSDDQVNRYLNDRSLRQAFRRKTLTLATLVSIDFRVPLTPSQRDSIEQLIEETLDAEELEFNPAELPYSGGIVHLLPSESMKSILSPTQNEIYTKWKSTKKPYLYRSAHAKLPDSKKLKAERMKLMSATIDLLKSEVELTDEQVLRLTTASKGEVERIVETEMELHRRWNADQLQIDEASYDLLSGDAQVPLLNGKFWNRTLETMLSADQQVKFGRFQKARSEFHLEANLRIMALAMLEDENSILLGKHLQHALQALKQKANALQVLGFPDEARIWLHQDELQKVVKETK